MDSEVGLEELCWKTLSRAFWGLQRYFQHVETKMVLRRMVYSMIPTNRASQEMVEKPDLFGPVMAMLTMFVLLEMRRELLLWVQIGLYWVGFSLVMMLLVKFVPILRYGRAGALEKQQYSPLASKPYGAPLHFDQIVCAVGYGLVGSLVLVAIPGLPLVLRFALTLSCGASLAVIFYRNMSVLCDQPTGAAFGIFVTTFHSFLYPLFILFN